PLTSRLRISGAACVMAMTTAPMSIVALRGVVPVFGETVKVINPSLIEIVLIVTQSADGSGVHLHGPTRPTTIVFAPPAAGMLKLRGVTVSAHSLACDETRCRATAAVDIRRTRKVAVTIERIIGKSRSLPDGRCFNSSAFEQTEIEICTHSRSIF